MEKQCTREEIKESAKKMFLEYGYEATSLSALAKSVGIRKASIYSHFASKKDIFLEVFKNAHDTLKDGVEQIYRDCDLEPIDILREIFFYYCSSDNINLFRFGLQPLPEFQEESKKIFKAYEDWSRSILLELIQKVKGNSVRTETIEEYIDAFVFLNNGIMMKVSNYEEEEYKKKVEVAWNAFLKIIS